MKSTISNVPHGGKEPSFVSIPTTRWDNATVPKGNIDPSPGMSSAIPWGAIPTPMPPPNIVSKGDIEPSPGMSHAIPWVHTPRKIQHPNGVRELVVCGEEVGG